MSEHATQNTYKRRKSKRASISCTGKITSLRLGRFQRSCGSLCRRKHCTCVAISRTNREREQPRGPQAKLPVSSWYWGAHHRPWPFVQDLHQERTICDLILLRIFIDPMNINPITKLSFIPSFIYTMNRFCGPAHKVVNAVIEAILRSTGDEHAVSGQKSFD